MKDWVLLNTCQLDLVEPPNIHLKKQNEKDTRSCKNGSVIDEVTFAGWPKFPFISVSVLFWVWTGLQQLVTVNKNKLMKKCVNSITWNIAVVV